MQSGLLLSKLKLSEFGRVHDKLKSVSSVNDSGAFRFSIKL